MAKKPKKHSPKELTRKQHSRLEKERQMESLLIWGVVVVGVAIVGVLAYGVLSEKVLKAREPVAVVNDAPVTTAEFQARVRLQRAQLLSQLQYLMVERQSLDATDPNSQFYLEYMQDSILELQTQLSEEYALAIGEQVLDQLVQEELVRQEAERRGIDVTPDELQQEIELSFGYDRDPATPTPALSATSSPTGTEAVSTPLPTPTLMTEQDFRQQYSEYLTEILKPLDISEQQYRSWFEAALLAQKLQEQMLAEVPTSADQVELRLLIVDDEDWADELVARLDEGEDFETLADEVQKAADEDEDVNGYSADLGWLPESSLALSLGEDVSGLVFSLEPGEHSQPLLDEASGQYEIFDVTGREVRELDQYLREQMRDEAFQTWLEAQQVFVERKSYSDSVPTEP
jgi:parvulin-like peptidyl-prolyl isomerase